MEKPDLMNVHKDSGQEEDKSDTNQPLHGFQAQPNVQLRRKIILRPTIRELLDNDTECRCFCEPGDELLYGSRLKREPVSESESESEKNEGNSLDTAKQMNTVPKIYPHPAYSKSRIEDRRLVERCPPFGDRILKRQPLLDDVLINISYFHAGHEHFMRSVEFDLKVNKDKLTNKYLFLYINNFKKIINIKSKKGLYSVKEYDIYLRYDDKNIVDTDKNIVGYCETVVKRKNEELYGSGNNEEQYNKKFTSKNTKGIDKAYLLTMYELMLQRFLYSYKLWYNYLKDSVELIEDVYYDSFKTYMRVNRAFEIAMRYMYRYPSIGMMFIQFLFIQRRIGEIREVFNKVLKNTHISRHDMLWDLILKIAAKVPNQLVNYNYVRRCLIMQPSRKVELFYCFIRHRLFVEAIETFLEIAQNEEDYDLQGKTIQDLYNFLFETLNNRKSLGFRLAKELLNKIGALSKYGSTAALYNLVARDRIMNGYYYEVIHVYDLALRKCSNMKDFSMIYDSYIETMKMLIELKTKKRKEVIQKLRDGTISDSELAESDSDEEIYDSDYVKKQLRRARKRIRDETLYYFKKLEKKERNHDLFIMDTDEDTDEEELWNNYEIQEHYEMKKQKSKRDGYEFANFHLMIKNCMNTIETLLEYRNNYIADVKLRSNKSNIYLWLNKIENACLYDTVKIREYKNCLNYFQRHDYVGKLSDVYISYALHYFKQNKLSKAAHIFARAIRSTRMKTLDELSSVFCTWIELNLLKNRFDEALRIARISVDTNRKSWNHIFTKNNINSEKRQDVEDDNEYSNNYIDVDSASCNSDDRFFRNMENAEVMADSDESDRWIKFHERIEARERRREQERNDLNKDRVQFYPQFNLLKSVKLVSLVLDMEMNYGTVKTAINMFDFFYHAKGITVKMVLTFADFLYKKKNFNEAFKTYEKGISIFRYPYVYHIYIHYIRKYIDRYKDQNTSYVRELFKQAIYGIDNKSKIPKQFAKFIFLMYAKFEEQYGLTKKALNVYKEAIPFVEEPDKVNIYKILISKVAKTYGIQKCREIFEEAISTLQDEGAREIATLYIDMEYKLNEYERVRALYVYVAQFTNPETNLNFYQAWREFEALHGDEHTFRDMIRIKKSVQRLFAKTGTTIKEITDKNGDVKKDALESAKDILKEIIQNESQEKKKHK